jgi:hypothetical protein
MPRNGKRRSPAAIPEVHHSGSRGKSMTVKELIKRLGSYPDRDVVFICNEDGEEIGPLVACENASQDDRRQEDGVYLIPGLYV